MSGLFGAVWGEPVPDVVLERALAVSPTRWTGGHRRYREGSTFLFWTATMENGVAAPAYDPGEPGPVIGAAGRFAQIGGQVPGQGIPALREGWRRDGPGMIPEVLGDWVMAVWDGAAQTLFLARDPLGQRTLYVRDEGSRIAFANDIGTLTALTAPLAIRDEGARAFLSGDFLGQCATMFEGVDQIPPGAVLRWSPGSKTVLRPAAWSTEPLEYASEDEYVDHFLEAFTSSVRARTAGGTSAILLSGGLDSPTIAAAAAAAGSDVVAYTFRTQRHPTADESPAARAVAEALGLEIVTLDWDACPPLHGFPALGPEVDDPYVGAYQASLDHAYRRAAEDGAVNLLSGDRGDLVLGDTVYGHLEMLLDGTWGTLVGDLDHERKRQSTTWLDILNRYVGRPLASSLMGGRRQHTTDARQGPEWLRGAPPPSDTPSCAGAYDPPGPRAYGRRQRFQTIYTRMHTMGAIWTERHASRHGLSAADPWSDVRVVDFALRAPQWILNRTRDRKRLARTVLRRMLPDRVVDGLGKVDPTPLFDARLAAVSSEVRALLDEPSMAERGWVDADALRTHYDGFLGGAPLDPRFWWAVTAEWWLTRHWT